MDQMNPSTLLAAGALLVALLSFLSTLQHRRERVTSGSMDALEKRLVEKLQSDTISLSLRISESLTKSAENNADISRLRLEIANSQRDMLTKDDLTEMLTLVLDPIKNHIRRQEALTEEILRAGVLRRDFDRNLRDTNVR